MFSVFKGLFTLWTEFEASWCILFVLLCFFVYHIKHSGEPGTLFNLKMAPFDYLKLTAESCSHRYHPVSGFEWCHKRKTSLFSGRKCRHVGHLYLCWSGQSGLKLWLPAHPPPKTPPCATQFWVKLQLLCPSALGFLTFPIMHHMTCWFLHP